MNDILVKLGKEIARAILAALLAAIGLESVGCVARGDGATCALSVENVYCN